MGLQIILILNFLFTEKNTLIYVSSLSGVIIYLRILCYLSGSGYMAEGEVGSKS